MTPEQKIKDEAEEIIKYMSPPLDTVVKDDDYALIKQGLISFYIAGRSAGPEREKEIIGAENPFPLQDVLFRLANAAKILLHKKNYDGGDYEEIELCVKRAEEIQQLLK